MEINFIPQDLRREEMILQVNETLKNLRMIGDSVFNRIEQRIQKYQKEIEDIDGRSETARRKVEQLKESKNKAIKIFSSYKFPTNEDDGKLYESISSLSCHDVTMSRNHLVTMNQSVTIKSTHVPFDEEVLKEKLQFYQIPNRPSRSSDNVQPGLPLGPIPWSRISSISSLVMFNSSENPYLRKGQGSSIMDSKMNKRRTANTANDQGDGFAATPMTIVAEEAIDPIFGYTPEVQNAPTIIDFLPAALPDLPGIADDLFGDDNLDTNLGEVTLPPLPTPRQSLPQLSIPKAPQQSSPSPSIPVVIPEVRTATVTSPPPPPPPPMPPMSPVANAPPAPPPPTPSSAPVGGPDLGRASLLDAIRKAGGRPKKGGTSKELKIERKLEKKKEIVSTDLMSDLANKLKARRTGISGGNNPPPSAKDPTGAMDRIAAMIPPPPATSSRPADDDEDSDWE